MKKFKNLLIYTAMCAGIALYSCEGPAGPAGKDANETCKLCHKPSVVDSMAVQFELSKHSTGVVASEEAGNVGCSPCHTQEAFKYVCQNNVSTVFTIAAGATTYSNPYAATLSSAYGDIGCFTCHDKLHTTYGYGDIQALTTTAAVPMTMWSGAKTINLTQDGGKSNLCVKCHQPRPFTRTFGDKNVIDYAALASSPTTVFFDGTNPSSTANVNTIRPSYRTHTHYGTVGAVFAGQGGVEFGTGYSNSMHTSVASCENCHMAPVTGTGGGHTFYAKGNFNGCNVTGCHSANPISATTTSKYWGQTRTDVKTLLNSLAAKLTIGGVDILNRNGDASSNLWAGLTTNNYDGYLNIYDPINNPAGSTYNSTMFQNPSTSGFTAAQIAINSALPKISLTNAQMGAIINFQLCLREFSLGIHNTSYTKTLLTNSIAALP